MDSAEKAAMEEKVLALQTEIKAIDDSNDKIISLSEFKVWWLEVKPSKSAGQPARHS